MRRPVRSRPARPTSRLSRVPRGPRGPLPARDRPGTADPAVNDIKAGLIAAARRAAQARRARPKRRTSRGRSGLGLEEPFAARRLPPRAPQERRGDATQAVDPGACSPGPGHRRAPDRLPRGQGNRNGRGRPALSRAEAHAAPALRDQACLARRDGPARRGAQGRGPHRKRGAGLLRTGRTQRTRLRRTRSGSGHMPARGPRRRRARGPEPDRGPACPDRPGSALRPPGPSRS